MWWMTLALAHDPTVAEAWALDERGCHSDAMALAAERMVAEPEVWEWHRIREVAWEARDGASYREGRLEAVAALAAAHPDLPAVQAQVAAAHSVAREPDCEALAAALDALATDDALQRYTVDRWVLSAEGRCPGLDGDAARASVRASALPGARTLAMLWDHADGEPLDAAALTAELERSPSRGASFLRAFAKDRPSRAVRQALDGLVEAWATSDDPVARWQAVQAARLRDEPTEALQARLDAIAPCTVDPPTWTPPPGDVAWRERVREADRRPTHALALEGLLALEADVPDIPEDRAHWLDAVAERQRALGQAEAAREADRERARLLPDDLEVVNGAVYDDAVAGRDLEAGLAALDRALAAYTVPAFGVGPATFRGVQGAGRGDLGNALDTRGWLLHGLGRHAEAAAVLDEALLYRSNGVLHAHAGLARFAMGERRAAFRQLERAHTLGIAEPELAAAARMALLQLAAEQGVWHPDGLEAWVDALAPEAAEATPERAAPHVLDGQPFPIVQADALKGGRLAVVTEGSTATVVDVWATWCGPCVAGMPHLQEVAAAYADRGVRVVGLSVDRDKGAAKRFFRGATVAYDLGWHGPTGFADLSIEGIPALFVLDGEGKVVQRITGYRKGDTRLEAALDAVLQGAVE